MDRSNDDDFPSRRSITFNPSAGSPLLRFLEHDRFTLKRILR
jgi:hypothetical protein